MRFHLLHTLAFTSLSLGGFAACVSDPSDTGDESGANESSVDQAVSAPPCVLQPVTPLHDYEPAQYGQKWVPQRCVFEGIDSYTPSATVQSAGAARFKQFEGTFKGANALVEFNEKYFGCVESYLNRDIGYQDYSTGPWTEVPGTFATFYATASVINTVVNGNTEYQIVSCSAQDNAPACVHADQQITRVDYDAHPSDLDYADTSVYPEVDWNDYLLPNGGGQAQCAN